MKNLRKKIVLLIFIFLQIGTASFAQEKIENPAQDSSGATIENPLQSPTRDQTLLMEQNYMVNQLKSRLRTTRLFYNTLEQKIFKTRDRLTEISEEINTLSGQLARLKREIAITEKKILDITMQILEAENNTRLLMEDIEIKKLQLEEQRKIITEYIELIYYHKTQFYSNNDNALNALKVILGREYISDALKEQTYLEILENVGGDIFQKIEDITKGMEQKKLELQKERSKLLLLNKQLEEERENLKIQQEGKEKLLEQTKGQKEIFQEMLLKSIEQQDEAEAEIEALRKNISYFNEKIEYSRQILTPEEYEEVLKIKEDFNAENNNNNTEQYRFPIWPITPVSVSAYFDDPGYKRVFGREHRALDLPQRQGTPVLAPDKGLVITTKDNGFGYSYIILAHRHNIMTLYGHVSSILVKPGEFVEMGQIIGLTGGAIGGKGSGTETTGPHLHFEVYEKGIRKDPLDFLKLEAMPIEYIPVEKLKVYEMEITEELQQQLDKEINELDTP